MPNWVENKLTIDGPATVLKDLWDAIHHENRFLSYIVPRPKTPLYGNIDTKGELARNWAYENWGTKWEIDFSDSSTKFKFQKRPNGRVKITGQFDSANGPPVQALDTFFQKAIKSKRVALNVDLVYCDYGSFIGRYTNGTCEQYPIDHNEYFPRCEKVNALLDLLN